MGNTTSGPLVLNAPKIAEALDDATGLIPAVVAPVGITVQMSTGTASRPSDWMSIEISDTTATPPTWSTLVPAYQINQTPVPPTISRYVPAPAPEFRHGYYQLRNVQYRNQAGQPGPSLDTSNPGAYRVDTIAPYALATSREQPFAPSFNNVAPGQVIDNDLLNNLGGLDIGIPDNTSPGPGRFEPGDHFTVYFSPFMDPRPQYDVSGLVPMLPSGNSYFITAAKVVFSGLMYLFYTLTDRAGNVSRPSFVDFRTVALLKDPIPLAPVLPLAPDQIGGSDDLLNIRDFKAGIHLHIKEYLNPAVAVDKFEVQWESQPYGPRSLALVGFPVVFTNMNDAIRAAYTATLGPQLVRVRYRIDRLGALFLSPVKQVMVDLSVEGPVPPITLPPGSENPGLNLARVFGAATATELNTLRFIDADLPVTIRILLWNIPALPNPTHDIYLLWGAAQERVGPFNIGTTAPGTDLVFDIDWAVVARHGNGPQPVSYVVTGPNTSNENPSGVTTVNVIDAVKERMAPAQFLRLDANGEWSCQSLLSRGPGTPPLLYAQVFIPKDPRFVLGSIVTVRVTISNEAFGFPPGPFTQNFTSQALTQNDIDNGFTVDIDYPPFLKQSVLGPCEVIYTAILGTGATGHGDLAEVYTVFSNPDTYCDNEQIVRP